MVPTSALAQNPSDDPNVLLKAALPLARSARADDQAALLAGLQSESYVGRLDSPDESVRYPARQLRIARLFKLLMLNETPESRATLVALTAAPTFRDADKREELLVRCLAVVRPAPPAAIAYWDQHSTPDHIHLHFVIDALCLNGSEPAIALLERKLADPEQDVDFKLAWMRDGILRHRNDVPLLLGCERMVRGGIAPELRPHLVDALCDYRRLEWYRSCRPPQPPPRSLASPEARETLRRICDFARHELDLTAAQALGVRQALAEIGGEGPQGGRP